MKLTLKTSKELSLERRNCFHWTGGCWFKKLDFLKSPLDFGWISLGKSLLFFFFLAVRNGYSSKTSHCCYCMYRLFGWGFLGRGCVFKNISAFILVLWFFFSMVSIVLQSLFILQICTGVCKLRFTWNGFATNVIVVSHEMAVSVTQWH